MINVSPVGRNCSVEERNTYEKYDKQNDIRPQFVEALKKEFGDFGLTYVLPWDCTTFPNAKDSSRLAFRSVARSHSMSSLQVGIKHIV